jgi:hypothetical protein
LATTIRPIYIIEYQNHNRNEDYLLTNATLREAEEWSNSPTPEDLSLIQRQYIQDSAFRRDREIALRAALEHDAKIAREEREIEQMKLIQAQRIYAELEATRARATMFIERRRSAMALLTAALTILLVIVWMWYIN